MTIFASSFINEFDKLAARSYVKKIRSLIQQGDFEGAQRLARQVSADMAAGKIKPRESGIKQLGDGSSNVVDLVHNPHLGLVVRKVGVDRNNTAKLFNHLANNEYEGFTSVLGKREYNNPKLQHGRISYWEPSFGEHPKLPFNPAHRARGYNELTKAFDGVNDRIKKYETLRNAAESAGNMDRMYHLNDRINLLHKVRQAYKDNLMVELPTGMLPHVDRDKARIERDLGGKMWDLRSANIVGNKVVDAELMSGYHHGPDYMLPKPLDARRSLRGAINAPDKVLNLSPIGNKRRVDAPSAAGNLNNAAQIPGAVVGGFNTQPQESRPAARVSPSVTPQYWRRVAAIAGITGLGGLAYYVYKKHREKEKERADKMLDRPKGREKIKFLGAPLLGGR